MSNQWALKEPRTQIWKLYEVSKINSQEQQMYPLSYLFEKGNEGWAKD